MRFTREQFDEIGKLYVDDLNIDDKDQDFMFKVFNELPGHIQGDAVKWGFNDTPTRETIFEYLVEKLHGMSVEQYYDKEYYNKPNLSNRYVLDRLSDTEGE